MSFMAQIDYFWGSAPGLEGVAPQSFISPFTLITLKPSMSQHVGNSAVILCAMYTQSSNLNQVIVLCSSRGMLMIVLIQVLFVHPLMFKQVMYFMDGINSYLPQQRNMLR